MLLRQTLMRREEEEEQEEIAQLEGSASGVGGSIQRSLVIVVIGRADQFFNDARQRGALALFAWLGGPEKEDRVLAIPHPQPWCVLIEHRERQRGQPTLSFHWSAIPALPKKS